MTRLIGLLAKSTQFPHAKPTIPFDYVSGKLSAIIPAVPFPSPAVASIDPVSSSDKGPPGSHLEKSPSCLLPALISYTETNRIWSEIRYYFPFCHLNPLKLPRTWARVIELFPCIGLDNLLAGKYNNKL